MKKEIQLNNEIIIETKVKELKKGDFFTKKPMTSPKNNQVWIRGDYCRDIKKYECINFDDINRFCYLPGNKAVFTDFIF